MANKKSYCTPLSEPYYAGLKAPDTDIKAFLENRVNEADKREVVDEFKKTLVLEAQKSRRNKARRPRVSKKELTAKEKRSLGLSRLPKVGLKYEQFKGLSGLWLEYMTELLDLEALKTSGWSPDSLEEPKYLQLQMKVCRADFHGAIISVVKADCPSHVGCTGICLMETKHTLQIISLDNKLRMMPKRGTTFSLEVGGFKFSFPGSGMLSKPAERATKKPKLKMPMDF